MVIVLDYPSGGLQIDCINTHLLQSGGMNALSLSGYSDHHHQIQKMCNWKGTTFKEYIREELQIFSQGMARDMKQCFHFVNILGGAYHDVTNTIINTDYNVNATEA